VWGPPNSYPGSTPTKGNTTAAPFIRGRPPSGPASTAFEVLSRLGLLCVPWALSPTRFGLFVATKPHTSGGLAALRVPVGEGVIVPFSGGFAGLIIKVVDYFSRRAESSRSTFLVCANWL
jgi:hypothetical protein